MKLALLLVTLAGCDPAAADADAGACTAAPLADTWASAGGATLTIVSTEPDPPARFENTWIVRAVDADGADVSAASIAVSPFMPAHGHGAATVPVIEADADGVRVSRIDLWMPGLWEVRFDLPGERVTVPVCIPR